MSPTRQERNLRDWDLGAVPTEVLAAALGAEASSVAGQRAAASCVAAITDAVAPPDSLDARRAREDITAELHARVDLMIDVRQDDWWSDVATLLVLGVPVALAVGPVPRKRHGWPTEFRQLMRSRAMLLVQGWGDAGVAVREAKDAPGQWADVTAPAHAYVAERTLDRDGDAFELTWHMPGLPDTGEKVRVGRWREYAVWHIGSRVAAVRLPPVLSRCTLTSVRLTPSRWVTAWVPDPDVWPDV